MDDNDNLYAHYVKSFALVRSGLNYEPKVLLGE
ncbi:hypothetical protein COSO111634_16480 [Corallococcus soli]